VTLWNVVCPLFLQSYVWVRKYVFKTSSCLLEAVLGLYKNWEQIYLSNLNFRQSHLIALAIDENVDITDNVQFMTFVHGTDHAFLFLRILLVYILQRHCNWRRFVPESRGFTWDLRLGFFSLRRMIDSFGATCRSRFQTSGSSRPHRLSTLRKIPKECRSHLHRSGSLKLRNGNTSLEMGWQKCTSFDNRWWQKDRRSGTNIWGCRSGNSDGAMVLLFISYQ
jgi:hypothetical protein